MRSVFALLLSGCAWLLADPYATPYSELEPAMVRDGDPGSFTGPKSITVLGSNERTVRALAAALEQRGFRVSRSIPGVSSTIATLYVVRIDGLCDPVQPTLHAEVFETRNNQSLFRAVAQRPAGCPIDFARELAELIDTHWKKPAATPSPAAARTSDL